MCCTSPAALRVDCATARTSEATIANRAPPSPTCAASIAALTASSSAPPGQLAEGLQQRGEGFEREADARQRIGAGGQPLAEIRERVRDGGQRRRGFGTRGARVADEPFELVDGGRHLGRLGADLADDRGGVAHERVLAGAGVDHLGQQLGVPAHGDARVLDEGRVRGGLRAGRARSYRLRTRGCHLSKSHRQRTPFRPQCGFRERA
jgi:hypothetical protein